MTEQTEQPQPDVDTAALQLHVAIQELTEPGTAELDRDIPLPGTDAWQLMADDRALEEKLWQDVRAAAARENRRDVVDGIGELDRLQLRREARTAPAAPLPSLLHQLQDAIPNGGDSGHSSGPTGAARSPLAVAALDLVTEIATTAGVRATTISLTHHVRAWAQRAGSDETQVIRAAEQAAGTPAHDDQPARPGWPERARTILDPPKRWTTPGACPHCKRTTAYTKNDDGETVRKPTLELDTEASSARCVSCKTRWDGESQLRQLAKVLTEDDSS